MKKIILFIALVAISYSKALPQGCLPDGIEFTTQSQIDSFQINYPNCTEILGDVGIYEGDITNLNGLSVLTSIDGTLAIANNPVLTSLTGLEGLTSIGGNLDIAWNPVLTSLTGLEGLTSIGGELFQISGNDALTSLTGLDNLTSIGGTLIIGGNFLGYPYGNSTLTSLAGLDNIEAGSINNIFIINNSLLITCAVQSICDYLVTPTGTVEIYNNAPGCNSPEEVEEECFTSIKENVNEVVFDISPNPVIDYTVISMNKPCSMLAEILLYTLTGTCLKTWEFENHSSGKQSFTLNFSDLPAGIYFICLHAGNETVTKKIIKIR
jgi:hypothetical protein